MNISGVGEMGVGETGVGEMGVGETGTSHFNMSEITVTVFSPHLHYRAPYNICEVSTEYTGHGKAKKCETINS